MQKLHSLIQRRTAQQPEKRGMKKHQHDRHTQCICAAQERQRMNQIIAQFLVMGLELHEKLRRKPMQRSEYASLSRKLFLILRVVLDTSRETAGLKERKECCGVSKCP